MLEPDEGKLSSPVLRGLSGRKAARLPGDAPHSKKAGRFGTSCGARPIQLFEGSRPWGGIYANSMVLGLGKRLREELVERRRGDP